VDPGEQGGSHFSHIIRVGDELTGDIGLYHTEVVTELMTRASLFAFPAVWCLTALNPKGLRALTGRKVE